MRNLLICVALGLMLFVGCKTVYIPVKETEYVHVHDTTTLHKTDTLVKVPEFHLSDYAGLTDTLVLKASNAEATAWVDTSMMVLKGKLEQTGTIPVQIVEKERLVYRDSVVTKEVPVPVEKIKEVVPKWSWWSLGLNILTIIGIILFILRKFRVF